MLTTIIFKIETENINCFIKGNRARTMLKIWKMDICIESIEVLHENLKGCWGITIRRKLDNVAGSNIKSNVTTLPKKVKWKFQIWIQNLQNTAFLVLILKTKPSSSLISTKSIPVKLQQNNNTHVWVTKRIPLRSL